MKLKEPKYYRKTNSYKVEIEVTADQYEYLKELSRSSGDKEISLLLKQLIYWWQKH